MCLQNLLVIAEDVYADAIVADKYIHGLIWVTFLQVHALSDQGFYTYGP